MFRLKLVPAETHIPFMGFRKLFLVLSLVLLVGSVGVFFSRGLNTGIDFEGGIMIEVGLPKAPDLGAMRSSLGELGLGQVSLQTFGAQNDILIRLQRQEGGAEAQNRAVEAVRTQLAADFDDGVSYRRQEVVGPTVSAELVLAAIEAVLIAVAAMLVYIWFRFEWHFSVGAVLALVHDVVLTIGMYCVTGIEFNLSSVAALLTIVGYSINDTVVVYDRVRENLRKYKAMNLRELLDISVNDTLARTTMTSFTTLLALLALAVFGGEVIRGFSIAMIWGIVVGTYSSIFVASPLLLQLGLRRSDTVEMETETEEA